MNYRRNPKIPFLFIAFWLFASNFLLGTNLCELSFAIAEASQKDFLVDFAIESNDIYETRTVDRSIAEEVFYIKDTVFQNGVVELLKCADEIVGFYTLKVDDYFEHELGHLFVKAGKQKQGLGRLLFNKALEKAQELGWDKISWLSDPGAKEFYLKMGAQITGWEKNLLNPGVDLPIFEQIL